MDKRNKPVMWWDEEAEHNADLSKLFFGMNFGLVGKLVTKSNLEMSRKIAAHGGNSSQLISSRV
jgi:hypothetical protein